MRPVFCGNFDYETRQSDLDRLFSRYGKVDRIDMKSGFAFVYFFDERDADDAIRGLDNIPFGYSKRRLSVEWSRQGDRGPRHRDGSRSVANSRPTKTLFVINFDPIRTRVRDIERHFEPYGKVLNVRIRRNFAFVQFETQEEATKAIECTNMTKILDRVVSVEYALKDDGDRGDSPRRGGYGRRGDSPRGRSVSPLPSRGRPSPDYGRPRSPASPGYGRARSPVSPGYKRARSPVSPGYGRARSPVYDGYNGGPSYDRERSPEYAAARYRSRSPVRRSRT
ncbi:serine/arginine-rich splicing factor RS31-like [Iris pallida]|uniref:Serine/arginine-rich splicing factor RS31-like n=2 Tax=Iris pallida TaxID=29817 RepID=A0AAX6HVU9_IRIPA|nr:serine/arginine-rich splicing factor RS31-like [Iris pallida]KAJ6844888.1 serine/arginine-rich splicing factor RS31-like [Iris pallida]